MTIISPFLDSNFRNLKSGMYLPIRSQPLYIAIKTSAYLVFSPHIRGVQYKLKERERESCECTHTMYPNCEFLYLQIKIQEKLTESAYISETYQVHNQYSGITILCCLAALVYLDFPHPAQNASVLEYVLIFLNFFNSID